MIPYGKQNISQRDIDAVLEVLKSDFLTQGPKVPLFEKAVATKVKSKYAVAVNSATSALHIACMALNLSKNDILWTTPVTFVASANCGLYCGAKIDFVDIDRKTYNICPKALKHKLSKAEAQGKLPKVLVAVHLCGQPCDMKAIYELSQRFGFNVIEDASHAIGGKYNGEYIGNCRYSDITVFSFHPVKIITTAEGGMATTNDRELYKKMELLRSHGITRDESMMEDNPHGGWYYEQIELGFNYRMTDLQAALGISQMERLDEFVAARHHVAKIYNNKLSGLPIDLPFQLENTYSGMHLYVIRLHLNEINSSHKKVFHDLRNKGVGVNLHYIPVHTHPYYKRLGFKEGDFPESEKYYKEAISIPMYPDLSQIDQEKIIVALKTILAL